MCKGCPKFDNVGKSLTQTSLSGAPCSAHIELYAFYRHHNLGSIGSDGEEM